jgi:hypothetical protein
VASTAGERIDCAAVNRGALNVDLGAVASTVREVILERGDRLVFSMARDSVPTGSLTLVTGAGAPRALISDRGNSRASYVADSAGTVAFRLEREGTAAAAFVATCIPAPKPQRNAKAAAKSWAHLPAMARAELGEVDSDIELPDEIPSRPPAPASHAALDPGPSGKAAPKLTTGLDTRLKWEGNATGASAPEAPAPTADADAATTLGVKYKLQPQIMVGVLAQFDQSASAVRGMPRGSSQQPWVAGPTATVQFAPGLALDAHAAWGTGETSAADRALGISATERRLLDAKLASTQAFGPWRFSPAVTFNYAEEKATGTTTASHDALTARTTGAGRIDVTPSVAYRIEMPQAVFIEPKAAVGSFWDIEDLSRLTPRGSVHEDMRLKAEAGVTIGSTTAGTKLEVGGGVEGGGPTAPDVWSGHLQLSVPLR